MKNTTIINLLLLSTAFFACETGSTQQAELPPPNILWISTEDIGPGLGCYGDDYANTPNLDQLASEGSVYQNAYATAPICSPARSCLITGLYATSLGTQHLRSDILIPEKIKTIPEYLRASGYFCTNNSKTDYNFDPSGRWDENSNEAHWRHRPDGKPFFSVFNFGTTHEGPTNSTDTVIFETLEKRHDPAQANLPPILPNTEEFRKIWARQYDLISVMDQQAGDLISQLKEDGVYENTIIFFFGDHGYGLPGYKRWLTNAGLRVPLIIRVPQKYQEQFNFEPGENKELVSFVDYAPSVLSMAGVNIPEHMEGQAVIGTDKPAPRKYVYGARSRADDVYDMARSVSDGRYIYIRHFMPQFPYVQKALIFGEKKTSYTELNQLHEKNNLEHPAAGWYNSKPVEELYDLQNDPYELRNLANDPSVAEIKLTLQQELKDWIIEHNDTGLMHEAEMMMASKGSTPYEYVHSNAYDAAGILNAALEVGNPDPLPDVLENNLKSNNSAVRFWTVMAIQANKSLPGQFQSALESALSDASPSVALAAAETLCNMDQTAKAIPVIEKYLQMNEDPTVVLQAAMTARRIGVKAAPLVPVIQQEFKHYQGDVWGRYKSWVYPMFIGFAFDQTLINCGVAL